MPDVYPIQNSFWGGVISPRNQGRTYEDSYQTSLNECVNWVIKNQGTAQLRKGFRYIDDALGDDSKLINFSRANRRDVMLEISEAGARLIGRDGVLTQSSGNLVLNPDFLQGEESWITSSSSYPPYQNTAFRDHTPAFVPLSGLGAQLTIDWEIVYGGASNPITVIREAFMDQPLASGNSSQPDFYYPDNRFKPDTDYVLSCEVVTGEVDNEFIQKGMFTAFVKEKNNVNEALGFPFPNQVIAIQQEDLGYLDPNTKQGAGYRFTVNLEFSFPDRSLDGLLYSDISFGLRLSSYDPLTENPDSFYSEIPTSADIQVIVSQIKVVEKFGDVTPVVFDSPYSGEAISEIQYAQDTAKGELILVQKDTPPYVLRETQNDVFEFIEFEFTAKDPSWADTDWPSVIEIFQGRLWLANSKTFPSTIWASQVGVFEEMWSNASNSPDDPLRFDLITNGVIQWLYGNKVLLIGTDRSEWIGYGSQGIITNDDFRFEKQSALGSVKILPQPVADQLIYTGLDSKTLRAINFDGDRTNTWASDDLNWRAEHLFSSRIKDISYARDPDYQLFALTNDGNIQACVFDRLRQLRGWYQIGANKNSYFYNIESSQDPIGSSLWAVVNRSGRSQIEVYEPNVNDGGYLDSYSFSEVTTADQLGVGSFDDSFSSAWDGQGLQKVAAGADRFNGELITVISIHIENVPASSQTKLVYRVHPLVTVVNGLIPLEDWVGDRVIYGRNYQATLETLPTERGNPAGTNQGSKRHLNRIIARMINDSAVPSINGYRFEPSEEKRDQQDILNTIVNEDIDVRADNTLRQGTVTITQDLPLATEISALFGKQTINNT